MPFGEFQAGTDNAGGVLFHDHVAQQDAALAGNAHVFVAAQPGDSATAVAFEIRHLRHFGGSVQQQVIDFQLLLLLVQLGGVNGNFEHRHHLAAAVENRLCHHQQMLPIADALGLAGLAILGNLAQGTLGGGSAALAQQAEAFLPLQFCLGLAHLAQAKRIRHRDFIVKINHRHRQIQGIEYLSVHIAAVRNGVHLPIPLMRQHEQIDRVMDSVDVAFGK